mgnify:FL=1
MKEYEVKIQEIWEKIITVRAMSPQQAEQAVSYMWSVGEFVLDVDDFSGVSFEVKEKC